MKALLPYIAGVVAVIFFIWLFMMGLRWFNATTVQHNVIQPKDGVECVIVTTTDGAAVHCWSTES